MGLLSYFLLCLSIFFFKMSFFQVWQKKRSPHPLAEFLFATSVNATSILVSRLSTDISTTLLVCAMHLARRKENLRTFLRYIVNAITQEVREQTSFPALRLVVALMKNMELHHCSAWLWLNLTYLQTLKIIFQWATDIISAGHRMSNFCFFVVYFFLLWPQKSKLSHLLLGEHDIPLTCLEQVVTGTSRQRL